MPNSATLKYEYDDEPITYEEKCLCMLVLDTSGSMITDGNGSSIIPIDELNKGIKTFKTELLKDAVIRDRLEVGVIPYNDGVDENKIVHPTPLQNLNVPTFVAEGTTATATALEKAFEIVNDRKQYYKQHGLSYYRPWIVLMTDGYPDEDQDMQSIAQRIRLAKENKEFAFMPIGIGELAAMDELKKMATDDFNPIRINAVKFSEFFKWLSNSIKSIPKSTNGEMQFDVDGDEWYRRMTNDK